jgi:hypothetical protein
MAKEKVDLKNRDFLRMYGTYLDDGQSARRAIEHLKGYLKLD